MLSRPGLRRVPGPGLTRSVAVCGDVYRIEYNSMGWDGMGPNRTGQAAAAGASSSRYCLCSQSKTSWDVYWMRGWKVSSSRDMPLRAAPGSTGCWARGRKKCKRCCLKEPCVCVSSATPSSPPSEVSERRGNTYIHAHIHTHIYMHVDRDTCVDM